MSGWNTRIALEDRLSPNCHQNLIISTVHNNIFLLLWCINFYQWFCQVFLRRLTLNNFVTWTKSAVCKWKQWNKTSFKMKRIQKNCSDYFPAASTNRRVDVATMPSFRNRSEVVGVVNLNRLLVDGVAATAAYTVKYYWLPKYHQVDINHTVTVTFFFNFMKTRPVFSTDTRQLTTKI